MKTTFKIIILVSALTLLNSCKSDSPVSQPITNDPTDFSKVFTAENGGNRYELWKANVNILFNGYNVIGIKYYSNGAEVKDGYVKFFPMMYHGSGGPGHSSPVKDKFYYSDSSKLFIGYADFLMISDSTSQWYADFSHNDVSNVDSTFFTVTSSAANQVIIWDDYVSQYTYVLTLIKPLKAAIGSNVFTTMLHKTTNDINYVEVNDAEMYIRPWMASHGHGSSSNINPTPIGNGMYQGQANFTMIGEWVVFDSIKYNGNFVTHSPPPSFYYQIH